MPLPKNLGSRAHSRDVQPKKLDSLNSLMIPNELNAKNKGKIAVTKNIFMVNARSIPTVNSKAQYSTMTNMVKMKSNENLKQSNVLNKYDTNISMQNNSNNKTGLNTPISTKIKKNTYGTDNNLHVLTQNNDHYESIIDPFRAGPEDLLCAIPANNVNVNVPIKFTLIIKTEYIINSDFKSKYY